jgi:hypothetical protein
VVGRRRRPTKKAVAPAGNGLVFTACSAGPLPAWRPANDARDRNDTDKAHGHAGKYGEGLKIKKDNYYVHIIINVYGL